VDVVFLLIIFLLVTTTFKKSDHAFEIRLPVAGTESIVVHTDAALLYIGDDGQLAFVHADQAQKEVEPAEAEAISRQIAEYLRSHPEAPIRVRAGQAVEYQKVLSAVGLLHAAGARNVQLEYDRKLPEDGPGADD
jgi:biopolymer transport protein ExbD